MNGASVQHPDADRLLELAYGELTESEAASLNTHVAGCEACGQALEAIGGVRRVMAPLGEVEAPPGGLESLLAYAEQSASRAREAPPPKRRWFWWSLVPVALTGLLVAGGVLGNARALFGASAEALSGETLEGGSGAIPGPIAFGGPGAENRRPDADPFAGERAALESRSARAPEQKRRRAVEGEGAMAPAPVASVSPPPPPPAPQLRAQRPARARRAPASVERHAEPAPAQAFSGVADATVGSGGVPAADVPVALGGTAGGAMDDAVRQEHQEEGTAEAEVQAPAELLADRASAPAEAQARAPVTTASPAPRPAGEAARKEKAAPADPWSVPTEHTQRIRARETLRAEVTAGGTSLGLSEALGRLCRVEDVLEEHTAADATCARLLALDPDSPHAGFARSRAGRHGGR